MPVITSKDLDIFNAKQFRESVSEPSSSNVYLTIGRTYPWINEVLPNTANSSVASFIEVWDNMIGGKRVTSNDIRHVIPRFDWTANSVYYAYDHMTDSYTLKNGVNQFYVVTDDYNVYKCIANNNGAISTAKPTSLVTTGDFQTADGYIWKYMYTVRSEDQLRFTTPAFIPVKTLDLSDGSLQWNVQQNAEDGAIHNIIVLNGGSGYTANDSYIVIEGDGEDANAFPVRNVTTNTISSIVIDNRGIGYSRARAVLYSASGNGSTLRTIVSPPAGHGSDPISELGGSYLLINVRLKNSEDNTIITTNDFRQIALIEEPIEFSTSNTASRSVFSQVKKLTLNGISAEYIQDENVYQGNSLDTATFKGIVANWDSPNNVIGVTNVVGVPGTGLLIGESSSATRFVSFIDNQDFRAYSGKLLYIDNTVAIERAPDQTEDFKIILNF